MTMLRKQHYTYRPGLRQSVITRAILFLLHVMSREKNHRGIGDRKRLISKVL